jgi:hypothetical protein
MVTMKRALLLSALLAACGTAGDSRLRRAAEKRCEDLELVLNHAADRLAKGEEPYTGVLDIDSDPVLNAQGTFRFCTDVRAVPDDEATTLRIHFTEAGEGAFSTRPKDKRIAAVREMLKLVQQLNRYPVRK